jgi:hypothetical protein
LRAYTVQKFTYCIFGSAVGCFGAAGVAGAAVPGSVVVAGLAVAGLFGSTTALGCCGTAVVSVFGTAGTFSAAAFTSIRF